MQTTMDKPRKCRSHKTLTNRLRLSEAAKKHQSRIRVVGRGNTKWRIRGNGCEVLGMRHEACVIEVRLKILIMWA